MPLSKSSMFIRPPQFERHRNVRFGNAQKVSKLFEGKSAAQPRKYRVIIMCPVQPSKAENSCIIRDIATTFL